MNPSETDLVLPFVEPPLERKVRAQSTTQGIGTTVQEYSLGLAIEPIVRNCSKRGGNQPCLSVGSTHRARRLTGNTDVWSSAQCFQRSRLLTINASTPFEPLFRGAARQYMPARRGREAGHCGQKV
jgi:hypothetical protein